MRIDDAKAEPNEPTSLISEGGRAEGYLEIRESQRPGWFCYSMSSLPILGLQRDQGWGCSPIKSTGMGLTVVRQVCCLVVESHKVSDGKAPVERNEGSGPLVYSCLTRHAGATPEG